MRPVLAASLLGLLAVLAAGLPATAHGEDTLQLGAERIQPGGSIEVRGDLGSGEAFAVSLISGIDGSRRVITTIAATEEGHFQSYVTLPTDVPAGDYLLEVAVDGEEVRGPLTVAGSPFGGEEGAGPEQEEGLLQPLPSAFGAGVGPGPVARGSAPAEASGADPRAGHASIDDVGLLAMAALAALAALAILAGLRSVRRGRSSPPAAEPD
jgi:hypothetical protein